MGQGSPLPRYALVGALNTLLGAGVIAVLHLGAGCAPLAANAGGYAAGLCSGYLLQRRFTFGSRRRHRSGVPAYAATVVASYGLNAAVLQALLWGGTPVLPAQAAALASYTVCAYLLQRHLVFRPGA
jgi:putative flippase GtrA